MKHNLMICVVLASLSGCLNRTGVKHDPTISREDSIKERQLLDSLRSLDNNEEDIRFRKEKEKLDSLISSNPDYGEYYYRRGKANFGLLRLQQAISDFKNSVRLGYKEKNASQYLAYIYGFMDIPDSVTFYQAYADR